MVEMIENGAISKNRVIPHERNNLHSSIREIVYFELATRHKYKCLPREMDFGG